MLTLMLIIWWHLLTFFSIVFHIWPDSSVGIVSALWFQDRGFEPGFSSKYFSFKSAKMIFLINFLKIHSGIYSGILQIKLYIMHSCNTCMFECLCITRGACSSVGRAWDTHHFGVRLLSGINISYVVKSLKAEVKTNLICDLLRHFPVFAFIMMLT